MKVLLLFILLANISAYPDTLSVAERRARPVLVNLHRGAWEFGPPNSMAAFRAALAHGGDMLEVDVRATVDGRLVCFHDDSVDGDLDGVGMIAELTYDQIRQMPFAPRYPKAWRREPVPLFADLLEFARENGLLFHLDIKGTGIDGEVARMLTEADYWQGVATVNDYNSEQIRSDPRYQPLPVKGGLLENYLDCEFDRVAELIRQPGQWLIVDDPRVAAVWLDRASDTTLVVAPDTFLSDEEGSVVAPIAGSVAHWLEELRIEADSEAGEKQQQDIVLRRARAALNLGLLEAEDATALEALRARLHHPAPLADYHYHALDAAMSARSLGRLRDVASVPDLLWALTTDHSASVAEKLIAQGWKQEHVWWVGYRLYRESVFALARIGTPEARAFLEEILAGRGQILETARPHLQALAADALVRHGYPLERVILWLAHEETRVRRRAFLTIISRPEVETTRMLRRQLQMWIRSGENRDAIALVVSACPFLRTPQCILDAARGFDHPRIQAARAFARGLRLD